MAAYLIAIDGTDASGKATQTALLAERLRAEGKKVLEVSYPDYDSPSSGPVKMYLEGKLGKDANDTDAYAASVLFAADRFASFRSKWKEQYEDSEYVILLNRYTTANAVHQLSKIDDPAEKDRFLDWLFDFEYRLLGIPAPDTVIYLEMPTDISLALLEKRCIDTGATKDIHELDSEHLYKSHAAAVYACEKLGWNRITCGKDGKAFSRADIHEMVYEAVHKARAEQNLVIKGKPYSLLCKSVSWISRRERSDIAALWSEAFEDDPDFIHMMLDDKGSVLADDITSFFALYDGGILCSMCFLVRIEYKCGDEKFPAYYLYAAATKIGYRGRSLFSSLLKCAEEYAIKQGARAMFCLPASRKLFDYYRRFDYRAVTFCDTEEIIPKDYGYNFRECRDTDILYGLYKKNLSDVRCAAIRSESLFRSAMLSAFHDGAVAYTFDGGYVIVRKNTRGQCEVIELSCGKDENENIIAASVMTKIMCRGRGKIIKYLPEGEPYVAAKPLNDTEIEKHIECALMCN